MEVKVVNREDARILAVRHTGPYPGIGDAFERLIALVRELSIDPSTCEWLAIFHDDPGSVAAEALRSDACVTLTGSGSDPEPLGEFARVDTLPGGRFAMTRHDGAYDGLPAAWGRFMSEGLPGAGLKSRAGVCFEIYRNDPDHTPADELITELYEPVES